MILVDEALRRRAADHRPVRVGMIGAGFMARGIARQIVRSVPGLDLVAIANRTIEKAVDVFAHADRPDATIVSTVAALERAVDTGRAVVTDDARLLCEAANIDVILEATGAIEFGAHLITAAIAEGKDVVSMNAELDATVGPVLQAKARAAGTILTGCDGDQPAVQMNLIRFVRTLGLTPLVSGNIKGLQDRYRTPETQASYAAAWGQTPEMVTSFADGTKISFEQALVANASGMTIARTGMLGPVYDGHVDDLRSRFLDDVGLERLVELGGIVDYVVGAKPSPGVFVFASNEDPEREIYLRYGKLGDGPLYSFYVPYHLTALEVPISLARVALFRDDVVTSRPVAPRVDVVAFAKRDLRAGETLDGIGGFATYGACVDGPTVRSAGLLPVGLAEGGRLVRDVPQDAELTREDVVLPSDRLVVRLRAEQDRLLEGGGLVIDPGFWRGRRVLVTGHTGFKGSWLSTWLLRLGAEVHGYALRPPTVPSLFDAAQLGRALGGEFDDVRDVDRLRAATARARPEVVLHLAAQPLVRRSYEDPIGTYATNVMGTVHMLDSVRSTPGVRAVVVVTSDKVYENRQWPWPYRESDALGGHDPYSSNKAAVEIATASFRSSYFPVAEIARHGVGIATARAGNVIGGGDWAGDRLVPDLIRGFASHSPVAIRNPAAVRPWQHVLEPLSGYLLLAQRLYSGDGEACSGWNFGPTEADARPVAWIADRLAERWGGTATWSHEGGDHPHEASVLRLDFARARAELGWEPRWSLATALDRTVDWYRAFEADASRAASLMDADIDAYNE